MLADRRQFALLALALVSAATGCQQVPSGNDDDGDDDGWQKPDIPPWGEEDPPDPPDPTEEAEGPSEAEASEAEIPNFPEYGVQRTEGKTRGRGEGAREPVSEWVSEPVGKRRLCAIFYPLLAPRFSLQPRGPRTED